MSGFKSPQPQLFLPVTTGLSLFVRPDQRTCPTVRVGHRSKRRGAGPSGRPADRGRVGEIAVGRAFRGPHALVTAPRDREVDEGPAVARTVMGDVSPDVEAV